MTREITIGRAGNCDLRLDPRCNYASNQHATILYDGRQLMFKDTSSNGTYINNVKVHNRTVLLHRGDVIMLARVEQSGSLISIIPVNVVNVKVASRHQSSLHL